MEDVALKSPIHALASASETGSLHSTVEEQAMCQFASLFKDSPDLSIEESEMMLIEHSGSPFNLDSCERVPSLSKFSFSDSLQPTSLILNSTWARFLQPLGYLRPRHILFTPDACQHGIHPLEPPPYARL